MEKNLYSIHCELILSRELLGKDAGFKKESHKECLYTTNVAATARIFYSEACVMTSTTIASIY